jgi:hypothetical protein
VEFGGENSRQCSAPVEQELQESCLKLCFGYIVFELFMQNYEAEHS